LQPIKAFIATFFSLVRFALSLVNVAASVSGVLAFPFAY
jgi:hypothetical protein